jgi:phage terminase Nu1 subunit (DNA packaging protein)
MKMATAAKAAKHICLSVSRFRDLVDSEVIARQPPGQYDLKAVRESYIPHMQKLAAGRGADHGAALSTQRARLATAQAQAAEMKNAAFCGDLVSLSAVGKVWDRELSNVRERFLSMPGTQADLLTPFTPKDRAEIHNILRDVIYEALNDVADGKTISAEVTGRNRWSGADHHVADDEEPVA